MDAGLGTRHGPPGQAFDAFTLDHDLAQLRRDDHPVPLRPKTFALLSHLVDRAGQVVTKQELLDAVWPGLVVTDDSLSQAVSELRGALGDRGPALIRTVPRRGYLFDAEVRATATGDAVAALPTAGAASPPDAGPHLWLLRSVAAALGVALVALFALGLMQMRTAPPRVDAELTARRSIAVMPFSDLSEPKAPHLAYAVDNDLTTDLGRFGDIKVIARESAAALGSSAEVDPKRVGRELDVRHVLTGSVERVGERLSVTVRLARTDTGALLWADRFDYPSVADWTARRDVSARLANLLESRVQVAVLGQSVGRSPSSEAVDQWMRGSYLLAALTTRAQLLQARAHFEAALAAQPDSVHALAGLAAIHVCDVFYQWSTDRKASLATAKSLARRALAIDPNERTALKMLSGAHMFDGEIDEAMGTTRRQLELNPNDAHSNRDLAANLLFLGRWEETLHQVDVAQRLNPLLAEHLSKCHRIAAVALIALHRYDEAVERARLGVAVDPTGFVPYLLAAAAEAHRGNLVAARLHAAEVLERRPGYTILENSASRSSTAPAYRAGVEHLDDGLRLAGLPEGSATPHAPVAGR